MTCDVYVFELIFGDHLAPGSKTGRDDNAGPFFSWLTR